MTGHTVMFVVLGHVVSFAGQTVGFLGHEVVEAGQSVATNGQEVATLAQTVIWVGHVVTAIPEIGQVVGCWTHWVTVAGHVVTTATVGQNVGSMRHSVGTPGVMV